MSKAGPAVVFPNKLGAAAQLAKLTGWNEVEKVSVEAGDTLSAFLRQIVTGCDPVLSRKELAAFANTNPNAKPSKNSSGLLSSMSATPAITDSFSAKTREILQDFAKVAMTADAGKIADLWLHHSSSLTGARGLFCVKEQRS